LFYLVKKSIFKFFGKLSEQYVVSFDISKDKNQIKIILTF